jgi:hypothetical protein
MQKQTHKQGQPARRPTANLTSLAPVAPVPDDQAHLILRWQRTIGNQAVQRWLATDPDALKRNRLPVASGRTHLTVPKAAAAPTLLQRDYATPPPSPAAAAQPDLTPVQIREAIQFNRARYDARNTRIIQDLVGTTPTGTWNNETIELIAQTQEEYGLTKDGKVGANTFRFLDREQGAEGVGTGTAESLLLFRTPTGNVTPFYKNIGGFHFIQADFKVEAQFSERGNCGDWEYRQEIRGNAWGQKPGFARANLNHYFTFLPHGRLDPAWHEDGNTNWAGRNYGHRRQPGRASDPINRYEDHTGSPDQLNGCIYKGEDSPKVTDAALSSGDTLTLELEFAGGIYRRDGSGRLQVVTRKIWRVNGSIVVP